MRTTKEPTIIEKRKQVADIVKTLGLRHDVNKITDLNVRMLLLSLEHTFTYYYEY